VTTGDGADNDEEEEPTGQHRIAGELADISAGESL
jgi:hypothetical protein